MTGRLPVVGWRDVFRRLRLCRWRKPAPGQRYAPFARGVRWLALALGTVNLAVALLASWALTSRQELWRRGILLEVAQEIVAELRYADPAQAVESFPALCAPFQDRLQGAELLAAGVPVLTWGKADTTPLELPVALGPRWRWSLGTRPVGGPLVLRLYPHPKLGASPLPPWLLPLVAAMVSGGLIVFGLLLARGLAAQDRLAELEREKARFETVALAGAGLAHRIRNPLAAIKGTAQVLAAVPDPQVQAKANRIVQASVRLENLVHELLRFARPPQPKKQQVSLRELAEQAAATVVGSVQVVGEDVTVLADPEHVLAILEELLTNARQADPEGELVVRIVNGHEQVLVEVLDRGPGLAIPEGEALQPYVTTKPDGTGLGLAQAKALATVNGGDLRVINRPDGGCAAQLTFWRRGAS